MAGGAVTWRVYLMILVGQLVSSLSEVDNRVVGLGFWIIGYFILTAAAERAYANGLAE